ncbi:double-strand break repair protein AddB [Algirhabdus cladophorae]|uniref:double-strand break repair protein AddB n=1 Tax=Algirhabdus cladophorae TaxID=3377108 RepID=UPI003B849F9C
MIGHSPKITALGLGVDFPQAFITGFWERFGHLDPVSTAQIEIIVNTRRMQRRITDLFDEGPATLLPRIRLLTDLGIEDQGNDPTALKRRLELVQLISQLLDQQPDLAARDSLFDLADSLASLLEEMLDEGVSPTVFEKIDVQDLSGHWNRSLNFLRITQTFLEATQTEGVAPSHRQRVEKLIKGWQVNPPQHPVILAGSTGSRGTTALLMKAITELPQGMIVLPGFDFDQPQEIWDRFNANTVSQDHPQYRFADFLDQSGIMPSQVVSWSKSVENTSPRSAFVSLALRPAPITDQWMTDGPNLGDLDSVFEGLTLVQAQSPREEAICIAARIRQAVEENQTVALITPDRSLTRQVTAALDKWRIIPDDSAGTPLALSASGRFLLQVLDLMDRDLSFEALLALLKNPITHSGPNGRGDHLRFTRDFELYTRRYGPPFPTTSSILKWAEKTGTQTAKNWGEWLVDALAKSRVPAAVPLNDYLEAHLSFAEALAHGTDPTSEDNSGTLWKEKPGIEAKKTVAKLKAEGDHAGEVEVADYRSIFRSVLSQGEVRDRDQGHPNVLFWGTLEARVQGADLVILASMNEGSWPEAPAPDPWLNRQMRQQAGLLLPERRIGLSAHDFQQAVCRPNVWITRSIRNAEAETVPSRWVNRITNLLNGLDMQDGPALLLQMIDRGNDWLGIARQLEDVPNDAEKAPRPSPQPPLASRPRQLSVTRFKTLVRDPYALYAERILRLKPLDPIKMLPDAPLRGIVLHRVLERFLAERTDDENSAEIRLKQTLDQELQANVPWPVAQRLWKARFEKVIPWFVDIYEGQMLQAEKVFLEAKGALSLADIDFKITGTADRIDITSSGEAILLDYKTGQPPSKKVQEFFDRQLLIEAAMVEEGAFANLGPMPVLRADFIGLGSSPKIEPAPLDSFPVPQVLQEIRALIGRYDEREMGYTARSKMQRDTDVSPYDHLSRYGEWDDTDPPVREILK